MRKLFGFKTKEELALEFIEYHEICRTDEEAMALLDSKMNEVHKARMIGVYSGAAATWIGIGVASVAGIAIKKLM